MFTFSRGSDSCMSAHGRLLDEFYHQTINFFWCNGVSVWAPSLRDMGAPWGPHYPTP